MKIFLTLLFVMTSVISGLSQNVPSLIDEQERPNCETLLAGIDNFKIALQSAPYSHGAIVISGPSDQLASKIAVELFARGALFKPTAELSTNIKVLRGDASDKLLLKYWIIPQNSPFERPKGWSLFLPSLHEPLILRSEMEQMCESPPVDTLAKELLAANKNGSIFVVVHGPTTKMRIRELKIAKKALASFDPKRSRILLRTSGSSYSDYYFALGSPPRTAFKSNF